MLVSWKILRRTKQLTPFPIREKNIRRPLCEIRYLKCLALFYCTNNLINNWKKALVLVDVSNFTDITINFISILFSRCQNVNV